jgi:hypothetical protein
LLALVEFLDIVRAARGVQRERYCEHVGVIDEARRYIPELIDDLFDLGAEYLSDPQQQRDRK